MKIEVSVLNQKLSINVKNCAEDIDALQCDVAKLSKQMDALPDVVKEDNYRTLLALRDSLEPAKPIKPINWDSMKEAFKGTTKAHERD